MTPAEIRRLRERRGLTQKELGQASGVHERTIIRIENGERVRPETMKALCAFFNVPYEPLNTITLIAPEDRVDEPANAQFMAVAETLPHVRYLVRPDGRARCQALVKKRRGLFGIIRDNEDNRVHYQALVITSIVLGGLLAVYLDFLLFFDVNLWQMIPGVVPFVGFFAYHALRLWQNDKRLGREISNPDLYPNSAYAFSDDAAWSLRLSGGQVELHRYDFEAYGNRAVEEGDGYDDFRITFNDRQRTLTDVPQDPRLRKIMRQIRAADSRQVVALTERQVA